MRKYMVEEREVFMKINKITTLFCKKNEQELKRFAETYLRKDLSKVWTESHAIDAMERWKQKGIKENTQEEIIYTWTEGK